MMAVPNVSIKIVLIGDGGSGKSCMIQSYLNDSYHADYIPTVFDNYKATVQVENETFQLSIWDTAGQEEYHLLRPLSYQQCDVFLICFSVNDKNSFRNATKKWYQDVERLAQKTPRIFVGTKIDARSTDQTVNIKMRASANNTITYEEIDSTIADMRCVYLECSALTQEGLKDVFDEAIKMVLKNKKKVDVKGRSKNKEECNVF